MEKIEALKSKVHDVALTLGNKGKVAAAALSAGGIGTALSVMASAEEGTGGSGITVPTIASQINQSDVNGIFDQIASLIPVVLPVLIACLAFRKGLSFFIGMLRGL